ncbi:hypothetical protein CM49_01623 [Paenibacillus sp. P1XP2]|nr:hypothetical protein CM49_01623 [Paenibacillus sp. P1XP2]
MATKEGVGGGYLLNPDTENATLGDLYRLLARGSLKPGWCSGGEELNCEVAANIQGIMDQIYSGGESALERYLDGITMKDVKRQIVEAGTADPV